MFKTPLISGLLAASRGAVKIFTPIKGFHATSALQLKESEYSTCQLFY